MAAPTVIELVDAIDDGMRTILSLARDLTEADGALPTKRPGWTVKDQLAHIVSVEQILTGAPERRGSPARRRGSPSSARRSPGRRCSRSRSRVSMGGSWWRSPDRNHRRRRRSSSAPGADATAVVRRDLGELTWLGCGRGAPTGDMLTGDAVVVEAVRPHLGFTP
jgi:hypothetical protein